MEQEAVVDSTTLVLGSIALGGLVLVLIAAIVLRRLCARGAKVGPYEKPPKQQQVQPKKKKSGGKSGGASPRRKRRRRSTTRCQRRIRKRSTGSREQAARKRRLWRGLRRREARLKRGAKQVSVSAWREIGAHHSLALSISLSLTVTRPRPFNTAIRCSIKMSSRALLAELRRAWVPEVRAYLQAHHGSAPYCSLAGACRLPATVQGEMTSRGARSVQFRARRQQHRAAAWRAPRP